MPKLYVLSSPDVGRSFALTDGATLGRDPGCAIVLRDASISRKHARFELQEGAWRVVDTGSRNGLSREGVRVETLALADGLEFVLGEVELRFRDAAPAENTPPPHAPSVAPPTTAPVPRALAPSVDADEIVLEGAWEEPREPAPRPPRASVSAPPPELERTQLRAPAPLPIANTPIANTPGTNTPNLHAPIARAPSSNAPPASAPPNVRPGVAARAPVAGQGGAAAARGVLQYQRVHDDGRALNADLSQLPVWLKLALAVLALAVFAGVGWLAFEGTSFFKGKVIGADDPAADELEMETAPDGR